MIKSITITGAEVRIDGLGGQNAAVKNLGAGTLYASIYPNIEPNADNVAEIPPNGGEVLLDANGTVYLLGTGKVQCTGTPYAAPNFKQPSSSSGSGGGGETTNTGSVGVYCGTAEFLESSEGVKSIPIDSTNGLPQALAAALASETGWELQSDGVTVLKDGGVGFSFSTTYIYLSNHIYHQQSGPDFRYLESGSTLNVCMDIYRSADNALTVFGVRRADESVNLTFVLAQTDNGEDIVTTPYTDQTIYIMGRDKNYITSSCVKPNTNTDETHLSVYFKTDKYLSYSLSPYVFLMYSCSRKPLPGEQFTLDGKRFAAVYNKCYSGNAPVLALPM